MRRHLVAVLIALLVVGSTLVVAIEAQAGGSESGVFPNRIFTISKGTLGKADKASYTTAIHPTVDCTWWVELNSLDGSAVRVVVFGGWGSSRTTLSQSRLTDPGSQSEKVPLQGGQAYNVTFSYVGKPGTTVLMERTSGGSFPTTPHAPILITSNADFTSANGVVGGSGVMGDPYVIEGWEITSTTVHCIEVRYTSAYFVIRNCFIHGDLEGEDGYFSGVSNIMLSDCTHATIDNVQAVKNDIGLNMDVVSDAMVTNSDFSNNWYGIHAYPAWGLKIENCKASSCKNYGIYLGTSSDFSISGCDISSNRQSGVVIYASSNGVISDNQLSNGEQGFILLGGCTLIDFYRNTMLNDAINILNSGVDGFTTLKIDTSNTIDGRPILYYASVQGLVIDSVPVGELILGDCQDVTVRGLTIAGSDTGILLGYVTGGSIEGCTFDQNSGYGIGMESCSDVTISRCVASTNTRAVNAYSSSNINILNCTFSGSTYDAIGFHTCSGGVISSNTIMDNFIGIGFQGSYGFEIKENQILYNTGLGINFDGASVNKIYHNNFVGLAQLAQDTGSGNQWDNGYPDGGNYWSDYRGHDSDRDGIGDVPREVPPYGVDRYPLMEPWGPAPPGPVYNQHAPITIDGDAGFTSKNGVVSGNGTWGSPYVIEGWEINISAYANDPSLRGGIIVMNTDACFVIRNCYVHSGIIPHGTTTYNYNGISIGSCTNAVVEFDVVRECCPALTLDICDNARVSNCLFESNVGGVYLYGDTGGSVVESCTVIDSYTPGGVGGLGILLWGCNNVSVFRNTVTNVAYEGLIVVESSEVQFILNTVSNCGGNAIRVQENVTDCEITGNTLTNASAGICLWITSSSYSPDGVTWYLLDWGFIHGVRMWLNEISGCSQGGITCHMYTQQVAPISGLEIARNVITNNTGPGIWLRQVELANVFENSIRDNSGGVYLTSCYNATVYHNNLIGNTVQASDDSNNIWDSGYPSGGNYWSDYGGTDGNSDGIGDTPYMIPTGSQDRYPLMQQFMI